MFECQLSEISHADKLVNYAFTASFTAHHLCSYFHSAYPQRIGAQRDIHGIHKNSKFNIQIGFFLKKVRKFRKNIASTSCGCCKTASLILILSKSHTTCLQAGFYVFRKHTIHFTLFQIWNFIFYRQSIPPGLSASAPFQWQPLIKMDEYYFKIYLLIRKQIP